MRELRPRVKYLDEHVFQQGFTSTVVSFSEKFILVRGGIHRGKGGSDQVITFQSHVQSAKSRTNCQKVPRRQGLKVSLHGTDAVGQELLHIGGGCLGEVGHGAKPATGCTVIQESADARSRILCQHDIICAEGFLFLKE